GPGPVRVLTYRELVGTRTGDRDALDLACAEAIGKLGHGRFFVTEYPAEQAALARLDVANPKVAERFELVVDGVEIANGYHELGDAAELRRRFQHDCEERRRMDLFCPEVDERFLAAMASGLPDCAGVALGVDRLLMLKLGASSLAEIMPFPVTVA
ncbi:MAG: elongation factor P lysine(34) lysyltransferase, partial [Gammaproteobacteria bacterium]|nr:elongation factor P lysine(34) lysyltransferase [Gammaproteobacteria bacterium]